MENRERPLNTPIEKAMLSLQTMSDELEREKSRVRTFDALLSRAQAGKTVGGRVSDTKMCDQRMVYVGAGEHWERVRAEVSWYFARRAKDGGA